jgi:hypothetical protein
MQKPQSQQALSQLRQELRAIDIELDNVKRIDAILVGRFHGSNLMPIKIGSPGWRCDTMTDEKLRTTADTIDFLESVV